ncbi:MAG: hypothetical protein Q8K75_12940 [Chlamydiales bacterium]|nr:hypothetical protein [Chlamydiales bacterium]
MLRETSIENYLDEVQKLTKSIASGEKEMSELHDLIDFELEEAKEDPVLQAFYSGERAFFQKQYKAALKCYIEAKTLPLYHFFCYRACAFLFDEEQKNEKALDFVNKALHLLPNDWTTLALKSALESNQSHPVERESEIVSSVSLDSREFDELTQLFQEPLEEAPLLQEPELPYTISADIQSALERRIQAFQESQKRKLSEYISSAQHKHSHQDYLLHVFEGWHEHKPNLIEGSHHTSGGYFLKWHGKGVAINPGPSFLNSLHKQGFHIDDVDYVIVNKHLTDGYSELKAMHQLNARVNSVHNKVHVIQYYLHQPCYQLQARSLKPHFKQERGSVHCLELFMDSPETESTSLSDGITLNYFPTQRTGEVNTGIGIRLDLTGPGQASHDTPQVRVGYASGTSWSSLLPQHFEGCDLMIVGVETTNPDDFNKLHYNSDSLGYFGCLSLLEEVSPRLALCCEYRGTEGDIRLEVVRKMRTDLKQQNSRGTTILPGDFGLSIDLTTLQARCSTSHASIDPAIVHVVRTTENFGPLHFLAPQTIL